MGNLKHTLAAVLAAALVGSLAIIQTCGFGAVGANKLTQKTIIQDNTEPAVLKGDGEGEFVDLSIFGASTQLYMGRTAYILTDGEDINLYSAADENSEVISVLPIGSEIKIVGVDDNWFKAEAPEFTGYVNSDFITLDYDAVKAVLLATTMYQQGTVTNETVVRSDANEENSVVLSAISANSTITILDEYENGWFKIYYGKDYDIGFIAPEFVEVGDMVERTRINELRNARIATIIKSGVITSPKKAADVKIMPSDDSDTITTLEDGTLCSVVSGGKKWTKIIVLSTNEIGYVKTSYVTIVEDNAEFIPRSSGVSYAVGNGEGVKLVKEAEKYLGVRYVYGGTSPSGFDCSGLVQYCCRKLGVSVNRSASSQYSNGVAVSKSNLEAGDLIFLSKKGRISHVVIYAGNGMVIHAPRTGKRVSYQSLSSICSSLHYVGARRVM